MGGWTVADWSGGITSLFLQSEEDVDTCSDRVGGRGIRSEVRDGLPSDVVLLVFQGDKDMGGVLELLDGGIKKDESVSGEEQESQKCKELDGSVIAGALGVLTGPQEKVDTQDHQVGDVPGVLIIGGSRCVHNEVGSTQRDGLFLFN